MQLTNAKHHGAALALVPGGALVHVVQQNRRRRGVEAAQTIASRLPIDSRALALTDHRLTIIRWDVFRPKLETWIALSEIGAVAIEPRKVARLAGTRVRRRVGAAARGDAPQATDGIRRRDPGAAGVDEGERLGSPAALPGRRARRPLRVDGAGIAAEQLSGP